MCRYWYDCEFVERGPDYPIDLISIGIVCEDGREYYAQASWCLMHRANKWVQENVLPQLKMCSGNSHLQAHTITESHAVHDMGKCDLYTSHNLPDECPWRNHEQMAADILTFMNVEQYGKPELWGYYSAYDHVAFCQLFGTMMDLPKGFPMYTRDIKQLCDSVGNPKLPEQGKDEHNALEDAKHNRVMYEFLAKLEQEKHAEPEDESSPSVKPVLFRETIREMKALLKWIEDKD